MKLTTKTLKQLIKEELNVIKEMATPRTKNRGVFEYEGYRVRYYVYPPNVTSRDNVEGFKGGLIGHYKVERDSDLYNAIANDYSAADPSDVYVVGLESEDIAQTLIASGQIVKDRSL
jgi:hypothetical protein